MTHIIKLKRTYQPAAPGDGFRVLVDRLWPRGLSHEDFHYDLWDKDIAPSTELRQEFHGDTAADSFAEFTKHYEAELKQNPALPALVRTISDKPVVTLLFSSHDELHNNAVVLRNVLLSLIPGAKAE